MTLKMVITLMIHLNFRLPSFCWAVLHLKKSHKFESHIDILHFLYFEVDHPRQQDTTIMQCLTTNQPAGGLQSMIEMHFKESLPWVYILLRNSIQVDESIPIAITACPAMFTRQLEFLPLIAEVSFLELAKHDKGGGGTTLRLSRLTMSLLLQSFYIRSCVLSSCYWRYMLGLFQVYLTGYFWALLVMQRKRDGIKDNTVFCQR